jgi:hypothetical protein
MDTKLAANKHSRGNEITIAPQRVTIDNLFAVQARTL